MLNKKLESVNKQNPNAISKLFGFNIGNIFSDILKNSVLFQWCCLSEERNNRRVWEIKNNNKNQSAFFLYTFKGTNLKP